MQPVAEQNGPMASPPDAETPDAAEQRRLAALIRYGVLNTPREHAFDRIAALAAELLGTSIAAISFTDARRHWFKATVGLDIAEVPRTESLCQYAIEHDGPYIIPDMHADPRFANSELLRFDRSLRFYAAIRLVTPDGFALGTLCVLDHSPRDGISAREARMLTDLAAIAVDALEQRYQKKVQHRDKAKITLLRDIHLVLTEDISVEQALERMAHHVLAFTGARFCQLWERREHDNMAHLLALVVNPKVPAGYYDAMLSREPQPVAQLAVAPLFAGTATTMHLWLTPDAKLTPRQRIGMELGIHSLIGCSLKVGGRDCAMLLAYDEAQPDPTESAAMLERVALAMRPVLERQHSTEQRALLGAALEATSDGVLIAEVAGQLTPHTRIVFVNPAFGRQTGYSQDELIGQRMAVMNVDDAETAELDRVKQAMIEGKPARCQLPRRRRDGSQFWADLTLTPLTDRRGTHMHWVAIQRDVTQERAEAEAQRQREAAILTTAQRLGRLTEQLTRTQNIAKLGHWRRALGSDEMEWSDLVYPMFGVTRETFRPTVDSVWERIHPEDRTILSELINQMEQDGLGYRCVYRSFGTDQQIRYIWSDCAAECDEYGKIVAVTGIVQDITEQKQAQATHLHDEKLRSIGQLTGGIAHDFNNLLTVISVNLEMMGDMIAPTDPAEDLRAMALQATESGTHLTSSLLAFARRQPLEPKLVDVNQTLAEIRLLAAHSIGGRHPIILHTEADLPPCHLDRAGFESAILNLLVNGRDAMPDGGAITVTTTLRRVRNRSHMGQGGLALGNYIVISVADTGTGMSARVQEQAFEPFFTTKPIGKGTGLGLSTVIGFARQSGGDVELTSELGHGTSVRILLPVQA